MKLRAFGLLSLVGISGALGMTASCSGTSGNALGDGGNNDSGMSGDSTTNGDSSNPCSGNQVQCTGKCVDLQTDNSNCGMCGKTCGMKESCNAGTCASCMTIDKDKDGVNACDDCDDNDPMVNPGAFEVTGNNKDDNCDGKMDEVVQCDANLASDSTMAGDFAKAIDICDPNAMAAYAMVANDAAHQIAPDWGSVYKPQFGMSMGVLATGIAADMNSTKPMITMNTPQPGTDHNKMGITFPLMGAQTYPCGNGNYTDQMTVRDYTEVSIKLKVPTNANSFAIDAAYLSAEYPESLCNGNTPTYDDPSFIILDSQAYKGNIAVGGAHNRALSVKSGLVTRTTAMALAGTGMDKMVSNAVAGGGTEWMTMEAPVVPGETITVRFVVFDQLDGVFDTQVLFDHFRWQTKMLCGPDTQVLTGDGGVDAGSQCADGGVMDAGGGG